MDERRVFTLAEEALFRSVEQIAEHQWDMAIPEWFPHHAARKHVTLREIVRSHAYDDAWLSELLSGETSREGVRDFHDEHVFERENPWLDFAAGAERVCEAVISIEDLGMTIPTSFGGFSAGEYLREVAAFRALRAHDISVLVGGDPKLPDELVSALWDSIRQHVETWRALGVYGPRVSVAEDACLQDRLLGLTGRLPDMIGAVR
jgi:hypothetical protein